MTDDVSKLKSLLFDQESARLSELRGALEQLSQSSQVTREELAERLRRLDAQLADAERRSQEIERRSAESERRSEDAHRLSGEALQRATMDFSSRLEPFQRRMGTPEALRSSVAEVLDDVIVEARENRQEQLTRAVAPLVVRTIKTELRNSQDEMVEALYPIMGRLVKAYVVSEVDKMMNQMNRSFNQNGAMLRFRSLVSGYSMAELALADTQRLQVEELYLIRRGSGALIQRWPKSETASRSNSDIHMSGVIAAINDFAANAFQDAGGHLRSFNLDEHTVFLRASPVYLLAAKCRGTALRGVETLIDEGLLRVVSRQHEIDEAETLGAVGAEGTEGHAMPAHLLADLKTKLEDGIGETHERIARAGLPFNPLKALAAVLVLALLGGAGWLGWTSYEASVTRTAAREAIQSVQALKTYPVELEVGWRGRKLGVSGFTPTASAKADLADRLKAVLPATTAIDMERLAVLPGSGPDLSPQIAEVQRDLSGLSAGVKRDISGLSAEVQARNIQRSLDRAMRRLEQSRADQERLAALPNEQRRAIASRTSAVIEQGLKELAAYRQKLQAAGIDTARLGELRAGLTQLADRLQGASAELGGLLSDDPKAAARAAATVKPSRTADTAEAAEDVGLAAERIATISAAAAQASAIRIPEPISIPGPTSHERLLTFVRSHAVFFSEGDVYRAPDKANAVIEQLAKLMAETRALVRVVGYTDERGGAGRNAPISQSRADKVAQALISRGVPRERLSVIGRASGIDLSPQTGPQSSNRRVEFEIGFEDEAAGGP